MQKFLGLLLEGGSANLKQEAETLLKDPAESGIDWNAPLYVFEAPTLHNTAITLKIADLKKFEAMLRLLAQEQLCTAPVEAGGYRSVEIKDAGVLLGLQRRHSAGSLRRQYGTVAEAATRHHRPHATTCRQKHPHRQILHPDDVAKRRHTPAGNSRCPPHGRSRCTDLAARHATVGVMSCLKNGRIYATLQNADFKGNTKESNQPFHPQNSRELQQAMLNMMHGRAINIS